MKKTGILFFLFLLPIIIMFLDANAESLHFQSSNAVIVTFSATPQPLRPESKTHTTLITPIITPTPNAWVVSCVDSDWGECFQGAWRRLGWLGIILLIFAIMLGVMFITPMKQAVQEGVKEWFKLHFSKVTSNKEHKVYNITEVLDSIEKEHNKDPQLGASSEVVRKKFSISSEDMRDLVLKLQERGLIDATWLENRAILKVTDKGRALLK